MQFFMGRKQLVVAFLPLTAENDAAFAFLIIFVLVNFMDNC